MFSLLFCTLFYYVSSRLWKKRHQCHQLYVFLGYEIISIKYMFASARKCFPPSLGYDFISINSISYTVVSASLFVSASLRLGYEIIPINFQTYLMNNSQTYPLIVKCLPPRPPCISCISYVIGSFLFIVLCWLCFYKYFIKSDKNPSKWQQFALNANDPKSFQNPPSTVQATLSMTTWNVIETHCSQHCGFRGCISYNLLLGSLCQWFRDMFVYVLTEPISKKCVAWLSPYRIISQRNPEPILK